ncbi:MAG: hypothetical protein CVU40_01845 [Chloroflexi bacterium HGW-Chloroflexi-2]|jgi:4-amino-4-deoxy-L-arabinose transferase-like glycosyltransferase|nr:MAG: hypothetical protein CVU40_01845 [Chloroflexi bacterium HGW-Chloroflexi-2]
MNEPSLLDFIKAKIMPWKYSISEEYLINATIEQNLSIDEVKDGEIGEIKGKPSNLLTNLGQYRLVLALFLAITGQFFMEPPDRNVPVAIMFFILSIGLIIWSAISKDSIFDYKNVTNAKQLDFELSTKKLYLLGASGLLLVLAFFAFQKNSANEILFNFLNLSLWIASLIFFLLAVFEAEQLKNSIENFRRAIKNKQIFIKITPWLLLIIVSTILVFYFRFYRLNEVLGEMFSDHAEKLLDVNDVLNGKFPVFFIRNTGREFFQFYWTAFLAIVFNTGISFMSLKIGTALAGFLTLPYIYLLGKKLRNKWVGILAFLFAGIAYWPNVISRVGLRFPFYPMFAAPALFYLIRGLRQKRRNDFIYSGIALGLGLHGYSSTRFLPVVVVIAVILFLIHKQSKGIRNQTVNAVIILVIVSFILFLPLFKYTLVNPEAVSYRMMTRLTSSERAITEPAGEIFLENLWNAETMFFYSNGGTWVHSIPNRPALDMVSAGLYLLGSIFVLIQYIKYRNWEDLFLLLAVPLLMMPSILSIAFPEENPSLNRTAGAIIPVFILVAIGFERVFYSVWRIARRNKYKFVVSVVGLALFLIATLINHDLVFNQFDKQFMAGAWNTSQMGSIIRNFAGSTGNADRAYVVPSPHWVDTRLVGINAGYPTKDYALWPEQFNQLNIDDGEKLVILKPDNQDALSLLNTMFPNGILYNYDSGFEGKDFYIYHIPPIIILEENTISP